MAIDLPPGKWTAALIGPWWPMPSTTLRGAAQHWSQACAEQQFFSQGLRSQWMMIAASNQGRTADDLISRYQRGEKFHLDLAEKYQAKSAAFNSSADAIDYLQQIDRYCKHRKSRDRSNSRLEKASARAGLGGTGRPVALQR